MASIRTSTSGPLVKFVTHPLRVTKGECRRVYMRRMTPGPDHGSWQPISTGGFEVICPSQLEASELIFLIGAKHFPRPHNLAVSTQGEEDDMAYLDWLLRNHFRIENCRGEVGPFDENGVCHKRRQVMFWSFLKGWKPGMEDFKASTTASDLVQPALHFAWEGR